MSGIFPSNEASLSHGPETNETSGTFQVFGLFLAWWCLLHVQAWFRNYSKTEELIQSSVFTQEEEIVDQPHLKKCSRKLFDSILC